jgi:hypothetical protein
MCLILSRQRRCRFTEFVSDVNFTVTGSVSCPLPKFPVGLTAISCDRWLVVVIVIVWCPLRILYAFRRARNRRVSVRQDSGDAGAQQASPIWSYCNRICFGARYESYMWAQRNSHFTWLVASCGNSRCLMPVTNMSYICPLPFLAYL